MSAARAMSAAVRPLPASLARPRLSSRGRLHSFPCLDFVEFGSIAEKTQDDARVI